MEGPQLKVSFAITTGALLVFAAHVVFPKIGIDSTAIALLVIAILPWLLPFLSSVSLPGGTKIEIREVKKAGEEIAPSARGISSESKAEGLRDSEQSAAAKDEIAVLREVWKTDANLALVGFRIEIEKRLRALAERLGLDMKKPLMPLLQDLQRAQVLQSPQMSGIQQMVSLGNQAAHGGKVSDDAAQWVLISGPPVLEELDRLTAQAMMEDSRRRKGHSE